MNKLNWIVIPIVFVLSVGLGIGVMELIYSNGPGSGPGSGPGPGLGPGPGFITEEPTKSSNPVVYEVSKPKGDKDTQKYSLSVRAEAENGDVLRYELLDINNGAFKYSSSNGEFDGVEYSSNNGKYTLRVLNPKTGEDTTVVVDGFVKILKPLTKKQLSDKLSKTTPDKNLSVYFASSYNISFIGIRNGDPKPTQYSQIYTNIAAGYWSKVDVTDMSLNDQNKIISLTVKVYYVE